jgi:hypothetical protein
MIAITPKEERMISQRITLTRISWDLADMLDELSLVGITELTDTTPIRECFIDAKKRVPDIEPEFRILIRAILRRAGKRTHDPRFHALLDQIAESIGLNY